MFTGIIEEIGTIRCIQKRSVSGSLEIQAKLILEDLKIGDSIAVNGVCLTVTRLERDHFFADVMHETFDRSELSSLKNGCHVNLERAMSANGRFGGHIVSGHVDGAGTILQIQQDENAIWYTIGAKEELMHYIVEKGSIAMDGISLTVARVSSDSFSISAIPHTVKMTVLSERKVGDKVNLETDLIGKYVEKFLACSTQTEEQSASESKLNREFLMRYGY